MVCDVCEGKKFVIPEGEKCETCKGAKTVKDSKLLSVEVEKGMQWGQKLAFYGEADQFPDTVTGDVVFQLTPKQSVNEEFEREGHDLIIKKDISLGDALSGAKVLIKHLDNREILLSVPAGEIVSPGEKRKIVGQGMPMLNRPDQFGDLIVVLSIVMPKSLTAQQLEAIKHILPPTKLVYNESSVQKLQMKKLTEKEQKKRDRMEEDQEYGQQPQGVPCAQQ